MTAKPKALKSTWLGTGNGVRLAWRVDNLVANMLTYESVKVMSASDDAGPFDTEEVNVNLVADQHAYSFDDTDGTEDLFYVLKFYHSTGPVTGDETDPVTGAGGGNYLTVQDLRDYGYTATQITNAAARKTIAEAEAYLEQLTGQRFIAEEKSITVDGNDSDMLPILEAIIQIDSATVLSPNAELGSVYTEVGLDNLRISNRHLTQRLLRPDDRRAPSVAFVSYSSIYLSNWYPGHQNIELGGWFGFTELESDETPGIITGTQKPQSRGRTPLIARRAAMLLAARMMGSPADPDAYDDSTRRWQVVKHKMRDQEINYSANAIQRGGITGDSDVDNFISLFLSPTEVAFV